MTDQDVNQAVSALARKFYLFYCEEKSFEPYASPWAPRWAMDYARIAVDALGFDTDGLEELTSAVA